MHTLIALFTALVGLAMGSFLAALTYRLPKNISIAAGRSRCPKCHNQIAWFDNIPLLSFCLLAGKCRKCAKSISPRYPVIELATAVGLVSIFIFFGVTWISVFYLVVFFILVAIFVIDLEHQIIPDSLVFGLWGVIVGYLLLTDHTLLFNHLFAGFGVALLLLMLNIITRGRGMGLGDVKFAIAGGTLVGWPGAVWWLFLAFLTGAVVGIILLVTGRAKLGKHIAFGPFLAVSLPVTLFFGDVIVRLLF